MKLLDRYLMRQFLLTFLTLVVALPFLFLITDLTDNLDTYLSRGLGARAVATSYIYFVPQLVFWGFPVAGLIATVFTIGSMTRHQEITAAKAGGVSFYRLAAPLIVLAVLLSGVAVGIGELVPVANTKRAEMLGERNRITTPFRSNFVFRTDSGKTLAANQVNVPRRQMTQVVLTSETPDGSLRVHQAATSADWFGDEEGWTLMDGYIRWHGDDGQSETFMFGALRVHDFDEHPEELLTTITDPDEMRYAQLQRFIRTIDRSGGDSSEYRVALAQKISLPLALFVIVLFGAPLATSSKRGGAAFGVGISLAVTMIYLMMFKVGEALGKSGAVEPLVAAWAPNGIFLFAALVMFWRVRS